MPRNYHCKMCKLLSELYERTPKYPQDYWVMTELFTMLHGGKDYCNIAFLDNDRTPADQLNSNQG
jgi:prepilin-type processing-associated H-X9-DG protein